MTPFWRRRPLHRELAERAGLADGLDLPQASAPSLPADEIHFVALPDGTLVLDEDEEPGTIGPLADAVESRIQAPYRAEAVRRSDAEWAVAARRIEVVELEDLQGDEAELVVTREGHVLRVDGRTMLGSAPSLERVGRGRGSEYVVRARRVDGNLWETEASAL